MIHRARSNRWVRRAAVLLAGLMVWMAGPGATWAQVGAAPSRSRVAGKRHVRVLEEHELRAIRGRQMGGGGPSGAPEDTGPARPWGFSYPDLGGYGQIGSGNQHISIPITAHGGRGLSSGCTGRSG